VRALHSLHGLLTLPHALALARSACRLPFLTAAAPVCYGLPACLVEQQRAS